MEWSEFIDGMISEINKWTTMEWSGAPAWRSNNSISRSSIDLLSAIG